MNNAELQARVKQLEEENKLIRAKWKSSVKELTASRFQAQHFYQVPDSFITEHVQRLRYNIRNLAILYTSGSAGLPRTVDLQKSPLWKAYMSQYMTKNKDAYRALFRQHEGPEKLMEAFLWRILVIKVFDNFRWAGRQVYHHSKELNGMFGYKAAEVSRGFAQPESIKKVQVWRADTVQLWFSQLDESTNLQIKEDIIQWAAHYAREVHRKIDPQVYIDCEGYFGTFNDIVALALELDQEISRQVALITWDFKEMEMKKNGSGWELVIYPEVKKRDRSNRGIRAQYGAVGGWVDEDPELAHASSLFFDQPC